jgi:arginyl-tRNA synthetase
MKITKRSKTRFFIHKYEHKYIIHFGTDIYTVDKVKCNASTNGLYIQYGHARSIKIVQKKKERAAVIYK